jgi:hypothetical protein
MAIKQICKSNAQERHLRQHESPLYKDKWNHLPKKGTYIGVSPHSCEDEKGLTSP